MEAQELQVGPLSNLASVLLPVTVLSLFLSLYLSVKYASAILLPFTLNRYYKFAATFFIFTIINTTIVRCGVLEMGYPGKYVRLGSVNIGN